jgi:hypothetical protein
MAGFENDHFQCSFKLAGFLPGGVLFYRVSMEECWNSYRMSMGEAVSKENRSLT